MRLDGQLTTLLQIAIKKEKITMISEFISAIVEELKS
jgi:hypothetical protein